MTLADETEHRVVPSGSEREPDAERRRLAEARDGDAPWRLWGPYLSERQWGTVREDYSDDGDAWSYFSHDEARSRAYRSGEDGIAGYSDDRQILCFALALWNGRDPILKERLFGLTNGEGNHGEDVKEYYFYEDATPTNSYLRFSYRYPQAPFPYDDLVATNASRSRTDPEYELLDTGVFDDDRYFDVEVEYAKANPTDTAIRITVTNRGPEPAAIHLLPTLWFRNTWSWGGDEPRPAMRGTEVGETRVIAASHPELGEYWLRCDGADALLFTENETNSERLGGPPNRTPFVKDGIGRYVTDGDLGAVNGAQVGTKAAAHYQLSIEPGASVSIGLWLSHAGSSDGPSAGDVETVIARRRAEADAFYATVIPPSLGEDRTRVMRQALAGMLWSKQTYQYDVRRWLGDHGIDPLSGDAPGKPQRPLAAHAQRRRHLDAGQVGVPLVRGVGPRLPCHRALRGGRGLRQGPARAHAPLGVPASERSASRVRVELRRREPAGPCLGDDLHLPTRSGVARRGRRGLARARLPQAPAELHLVGQPQGPIGEQPLRGRVPGPRQHRRLRSSPHRCRPADTSSRRMARRGWRCSARTCSRSPRSSRCTDPAYAQLAEKFVEHFLWIATSMMHAGADTGMWDEEDGFFYDVLRLPDGSAQRLKVRSMVGLLPLCAVTSFEGELLDRYPELAERMRGFLDARPELRSFIHDPTLLGVNGRRLGSILDETKLRRVLARMLDESEFLSPHGIRSLSRHHAEHPYEFDVGGAEYRVTYLPAESDSGCSAATRTGAARSGCPSTR